MKEEAEVLLLLGGNRGDLPDTFARARSLVEARVGVVLARSRDHWTEPWGFQDQQLFLNRALLVRAKVPADEALRRILTIELELGRERTGSGTPGPRTIDIDILLWGDRVIHWPQLDVPHPRMHLRHFALAPAADVAPGMRHPLLGRTMLQLLNDLHGSA